MKSGIEWERNRAVEPKPCLPARRLLSDMKESSNPVSATDVCLPTGLPVNLVRTLRCGASTAGAWPDGLPRNGDTCGFAKFASFPPGRRLLSCRRNYPPRQAYVFCKMKVSFQALC